MKGMELQYCNNSLITTTSSANTGTLKKAHVKNIILTIESGQANKS